jgi:hypothetical protein
VWWQKVQQALQHAAARVIVWWGQLLTWLGDVWSVFISWTCSLGDWVKNMLRRGK